MRRSAECVFALLVWVACGQSRLSDGLAGTGESGSGGSESGGTGGVVQIGGTAGGDIAGSGGVDVAGSGGVDVGGSGGDAPVSCTMREPQQHRSLAFDCDNARPPGDPPPAVFVMPAQRRFPTAGADGGAAGAGPSPPCVTDAECTAGKNGRCEQFDQFGAMRRCTYDTCITDRDCTGRGVGPCICEGGFESDANVCAPGYCKSDRDCPGSFCSPSLLVSNPCPLQPQIEYRCHTCEDECVDDGDCGASPSGRCAFDGNVSHWVCIYPKC